MCDYLMCCGAYLAGIALPKTPEALMRSRYTAYSLGNIEYIKQTMQGKPHIAFNELKAKNWAKRVHWIGLVVFKMNGIDNMNEIKKNENQGWVEFIATYLNKTHLNTIHEISEFERINGQWFYVDGQLIADSGLQKILSRQDLCPCGSQKKIKNCHT